MRHSFSAIFLLTLSTFVTPAAADPIRVTYGYVEWDYGDPWVFAVRGDGFEAVSKPTTEVPGGIFSDPRSRCLDISPCSAGSSVNLGASYSGTFLGSGYLKQDSDHTVYYDGTFEFAAANGTVPAGGWVYAPFTFAGTLIGYDNIGRAGTPLFVQPLFGSGQVSVYFQETPISGKTGYSVWMELYKFEDTSAVPEPATLLLFGAGIAGAAFRRRRHAA